MSLFTELSGGRRLVPLNTLELSEASDNLFNRCATCRDVLNKQTTSLEHIYPKWLQRKFDLWNQTIMLPNKTTIPYRLLTVPCCKQCNSGAMSAWEDIVKDAFDQGYNAVSKLEGVLIWWLMKLYYLKLLKETGLKADIKDPASAKLLSHELFLQYNPIYIYMCDLLKGIRFHDPKPYELYIFKTENSPIFNYMDDVLRHVIYIHINNTIVVCSFSSFNFFNIQYEREINALYSLNTVHPLQAMELYAKIIYFRSHYGFETKQAYELQHDGAYITSEILNPCQIQEFKLLHLHNMLREVFVSQGVPDNFPPFQESSMMSLIIDGKGCAKDWYS